MKSKLTLVDLALVAVMLIATPLGVYLYLHRPARTDWEAYYAKQREAEREYIKQHGEPEPYHNDNFIETIYPW